MNPMKCDTANSNDYKSNILDKWAAVQVRVRLTG